MTSKNKKYMEADPFTKATKKLTKNDELYRRKTQQISCNKSIRRIFFPTVWVRRPFQINHGVDKFILDNGYNILLYIGCIFWALFFLLRN